MGVDGEGRRAPLRGGFAVGLGAGFLAGLLLSIAPVILVGFVAVAILAGVAATARPDLPRPTFLAGLLVGAGVLLTFGAVNTIVPCAATGDFCGHANPWPLLLLALVTVGAGALLAWSIVRRRPG